MPNPDVDIHTPIQAPNIARNVAINPLQAHHICKQENKNELKSIGHKFSESIQQ